MRTITTKKGTHEVRFAHAPTFDGKCMIRMDDNRRIPAIAEEFDGLESIRYADNEAGLSCEWTDYSRVDGIITVSPGVVQITLDREV